MEKEKILKNHNDWQKEDGGVQADFWGVNLRDANFRGADLQDADFRGANLRDANFRGANLQDADFWDANLQDADFWGANFQDANFRDANLQDADFRGANLRDANFRGANLQDANFRGADLQDADFWGANLQDANFRGAVNLKRAHQSNLAILKMQKGKLRAFKYLDKNKSPYQDQIYEVGETYKTDDFDTDERVLCGRGLNVATLDWCLLDSHYNLAKTYIEVEFDADDIVAIPYNTDGKFRVRKLKVIRKMSEKELLDCLKPVYPTGTSDWNGK